MAVRHARLTLACAALLAARPAPAQPEKDWGTQTTAHFTVRHQRLGFSPGDLSLIERIYSALHPDLWRLVPWMAERRTDLYLYKDRESYLGGKFGPPPWSGGLLAAGDGETALAVFEPIDTAIVAHELTHLYFHSYFDEKGARPPPWLDEGLAGLLQDSALAPPDSREKGPVLRSVAPMAEFLAARPGRDAPGAWVSSWYRQAHSVVRFLKRGHIDLKFSEFCEKLRSGAEAEAALKEVYEYEDLAAFESAWQKWRPKKAIGEAHGLGD
ncbi:MAG: hypothetical protein HY553_19170 [Elusimicrobia bacterium]|nr:hypothetical protein [Elusimicrobiota bacterium]